MKKRSVKLIVAIFLILAVAAVVIIKLLVGHDDNSVVNGETTETVKTTQQEMPVIPNDANGIYASEDGRANYYYKSGTKMLNAGWYDMSDTLKVEVDSDGHNKV